MKHETKRLNMADALEALRISDELPDFEETDNMRKLRIQLGNTMSSLTAQLREKLLVDHKEEPYR